jgi:multidrug resistance protein MdtO
VMHAMASEVKGTRVEGVPDIRVSAMRMQEATRDYYHAAGQPIPPMASDVLGLAQSLATILAPLYEDIRDTFAAPDYATGNQTKLAPGEA